MFRRQNMRTRRTGLGLGIALYLFSLFAPFAHAHEFGEEPHDHDGEPCKVYQLQEATKQALVVTPTVFVAAVFAAEPAVEPAASVAAKSVAVAYASRAPPA